MCSGLICAMQWGLFALQPKKMLNFCTHLIHVLVVQRQWGHHTGTSDAKNRFRCQQKSNLLRHSSALMMEGLGLLQRARLRCRFQCNTCTIP